MSEWRYFEFTIDGEETTLTPNDEPIRESTTAADALISTDFSKGPEGTFIYRMSGSPDEIVPGLRELDTVIQAEASPTNSDQFGLIVHNEVSPDNLLYRLKDHPIILDMPIDLRSRRAAQFRITAPDEMIDLVYEKLKTEPGVRLEKIGYCQPARSNPLHILTERQREVLQAAVEGGYYNIPREISTTELGRQFGISSQVASEHIRKIESKIVEHIKERPGENPSPTDHSMTKDIYG